MRDRRIATALAVVLWGVTTVFGFVLISEILDLAMRIYAAFWGQPGAYTKAYWGAVTVRQLLVLPLAMAVIAVAIGGAEYHTRYVGTPASWRLFARTLAAELGVWLLTALV